MSPDLRKPCSAEEHGDSVATRIGRDFLQHLDRVVGEEVVEHEPANVAKHARRVVPTAEEPEDVSVVVQELLEGVKLLIRSQRLH